MCFECPSNSATLGGFDPAGFLVCNSAGKRTGSASHKTGGQGVVTATPTAREIEADEKRGMGRAGGREGLLTNVKAAFAAVGELVQASGRGEAGDEAQVPEGSGEVLRTMALACSLLAVREMGAPPAPEKLGQDRQDCGVEMERRRRRRRDGSLWTCFDALDCRGDTLELLGVKVGVICANLGVRSCCPCSPFTMQVGRTYAYSSPTAMLAFEDVLKICSETRFSVFALRPNVFPSGRPAVQREACDVNRLLLSTAFDARMFTQDV